MAVRPGKDRGEIGLVVPALVARAVSAWGPRQRLDLAAMLRRLDKLDAPPPRS